MSYIAHALHDRHEGRARATSVTRNEFFGGNSINQGERRSPYSSNSEHVMDPGVLKCLEMVADVLSLRSR